MLTIQAAMGEFAHSAMKCINSLTGLFFVITTSLKMVACYGLYADIVSKQSSYPEFPVFCPDYVMPHIRNWTVPMLMTKLGSICR